MPRSTPRGLADLTWPVTTDRLSIRPAEQRDAAATYAFRSLPEVAEWVTSRPTDLTSWEQGYGDMVFVPDWGTIRRLPHLEKTALVQCDLTWMNGEDAACHLAPS